MRVRRPVSLSLDKKIPTLWGLLHTAVFHRRRLNYLMGPQPSQLEDKLHLTGSIEHVHAFLRTNARVRLE